MPLGHTDTDTNTDTHTSDYNGGKLRPDFLTNTTRRTHAVGQRRRCGLVDDSQHLSDRNGTQAARTKEPGEGGARAREGRSQRGRSKTRHRRAQLSATSFRFSVFRPLVCASSQFRISVFVCVHACVQLRSLTFNTCMNAH